MNNITIKCNYSILHSLTIIFVVLKLCNIIDWKWIIVLLPSIIKITIILIALIILILFQSKT